MTGLFQFELFFLLFSIRPARKCNYTNYEIAAEMKNGARLFRWRILVGPEPRFPLSRTCLPGSYFNQLRYQTNQSPVKDG